MPRDRPPQALRPGNFTAEARHKAFDLAIVKNNTVDLVTQQTADGMRPICGDQIRGNMDDVGWNIKRPKSFEVDLLPTQHLIRGDLKDLTHRALHTNETHQGIGEVGIPGEGPQRAAVAWDDDAFAAQDSINHGPGAGPTPDAKWDLRG